MKIKLASVELLNSEFKKNEIYCIGCGKRLFEMIELYQKEPFLNCVTALLDNNEELWGLEEQVGERKLKIANPIVLKKVKNAILLITSDHYSEIYNSIKEYIGDNKIKIYRYPKYYYRWTQMLLDILGVLPKKRQILFCAGDEPHENADEIVAYLNENYTGKKYTVVYLGKNRTQQVIADTYIESDTVRFKSSLVEVFNYCRLYASSKYLCYENQAIDKVNNLQCLIFLNHGTIPLKNVNDVLKQPENIDIGVCPGEGCAKLYAEQYGITTKKQIYIMPARTNRMLRIDGKIHRLLNIEDKKVILWLPTFRQLKGSERKDSTCINPIEIIENNCFEINSCLEEMGIVLAIKKHPREKAEFTPVNSMNNIMLLRDEQIAQNNLCLQDLLKDTDALITDYSGISFEYMLLDRPIGYVIPDIKEYQRGFAVDNPKDFMPGEIIINKQQFLSFIKNVASGEDVFASARRKLVNDLFGEKAYGNGAEAFIDYLDRRDR